MFLSNRPTRFTLCTIIAFFAWSCGSGPAGDNSDLPAGPVSQYPFSTREPEIFQANITITSNGAEKRWFMARSGARWRLDIFADGKASLTQITAGKVFLIDHGRKIYTEEPQGNTISPPDPHLSSFFRGRDHLKFEDLGAEDGIRKYRAVTSDAAKEEIVIHIDGPSGMIVRQEFYAGTGVNARLAAVYEVRDLKLEADDSVFALPAGYGAVAYEEFHRPLANASPAGRP